MTDQTSADIKKKQQLNLLIAVAAVCLVAYVAYALIDREGDVSKKPTKSKTQTIAFASPLKKVDAESVILDKYQTQAAEQKKATDDLQSKINGMSQEKIEQVKSEAQSKTQIDELNAKLQKLQSQIEAMASQPSSNVNGGSDFLNKGVPGQVNHALPMQQGIAEEVFELLPTERPEDLVPIKNPDTYVPSGTFVQAVMIGGADASAAVNAQGNPTPMVFRITEQGTLPNHAKSHLKDCVVTAAVVGDISSERGMIRLETMSCTKPDNSIVDMSVEGTIFGPEGKNGVRGIPMWREGALLGRAAAAGMLSGFSNGLQQSYTTSSVSALGSTSTVNNSDIAKYGAASGASNAMDKLADYEIQRAQQYHPVIQLSAGTKVDVVFLKGFFLDGKKHDEADKEPANPGARTELFKHDNAQPKPSATSSSTLPLTNAQVQKLQQHETDLGFSS